MQRHCAKSKPSLPRGLNLLWAWSIWVSFFPQPQINCYCPFENCYGFLQRENQKCRQGWQRIISPNKSFQIKSLQPFEVELTQSVEYTTKPTKQHHMKFSFFEAVSEKRLQRRCGLYIFFQGFVDPDSSYPGGGRVLPSVNQQRDRCLFYELLLLFLTSICQDRAELWEGVAASTQCYFKLTSLSFLLSPCNVLNKKIKKHSHKM